MPCQRPPDGQTADVHLRLHSSAFAFCSWLQSLSSIANNSCRWPEVAEVSRKVLGWRMKAMPYLYTAFHDSHTAGCPVARPVWFSFSWDASTLTLKEQWMVGESAMTAHELRLFIYAEVCVMQQQEPATGAFL